MPEEEKDTTGADDAGTGAGDGADQDQGKGEAGDKNTEEKKDGGEGDDAGGEDDKNPPEKKEESQKGEDGEPEIKTRKSPKDFIIARQQRKIEKLKAKAGDDDDEDDDSDEKDDSSDDEKAIEKVVEKKLTPFIQRQLDEEADQEVRTFIKEKPEFASYEKEVRRRMVHPSRAQLPISSIFYEVAGPDLMKLGAQKKKEADEEADQSNAGGGSSRETAGKKTDWAAMPNEDFAQQLQKIKTAPRED